MVLTGVALVLVIAILAEAVWETLKMAWQGNKFSIDKLGALVIGIIVAVCAQVDLFSMFGVVLAYPIIGYILTGIIISRGANFVHDLLKKLENPTDTG